MVRKRREVQKFMYPVETGTVRALVDMFKPIPILALFHISMFLLFVSGITLDLIRPWIGTTQLRQLHGYTGAFFTIMFVLYIGIIAINKDFRALREPINYVEIVFYVGLILFGFALRFPNLLPFLSPITSFHCTLLTYGWAVVSALGGGGIIQGVASIYFLLERARSRSVRDHRAKEEERVDNE